MLIRLDIDNPIKYIGTYHHILFIDDDLYAEAVAAGEDATAALAVINKLPQLHQIVFKFLISFLQVFARFV